MHFFNCTRDVLHKKHPQSMVASAILDWKPLRKIIMRLQIISFLIVIGTIHVAARSYGQELNIVQKEISLRTAIEAIETQTGYSFWYQEELIDPNIRISINLKNASLKDALYQVFRGTGLIYQVYGKSIALRKIGTPEKNFMPEANAKTEITGIITDESGQPISGASVVIKGTKVGVATDRTGRFSIQGSAGDILVISSVGHETIELTYKGQSFFNASLKAKVGQMEDMVVKGYYTTTKKANTGNVSTVTAQAIAEQPISDPLAALQGKVPGLLIQQNNGQPGRAFTVRLRGRNSIANGNDPLYIVDGVQFNSKQLNSPSFVGSASPLNDINPADIESIEVLKDADATAIYGSRGANGVILINTKRGKVGKAEFTANVYQGAGVTTRKLDLLNTQEYLSMRRQAFKNDGVSPKATDYDVNGTWDTTRYTDWQKVLIGNTARITDAQVSLSAGNSLIQFRLGGGYHKETTVFAGNSKSEKGSLSFALNYTSLNNKLRMSFTNNLVMVGNKLPSGDLTQRILTPPDAPALYDSLGKLNWANSTWSNPLAPTLQDNFEKTQNIISNFTLSYQLLEGLFLKGNFGFNSDRMDQDQYSPFSSFNPNNVTDPSTYRTAVKASNKIQTWVVEPQINYSRKLWKGKIDALVGSTFQRTKSEAISQLGIGFSTDAMLKNFAAATSVFILDNPMVEYRYSALYGRVGYTLLDKYVLNLTGRRDGSSRFGVGNQFGNFGAIGAAWIFSNEDFITKNLPFLSFGKLRGSIGTTGNDKLTDYAYLSTYSSYGYSYQGANGLYPTSLTNPYFGWEKVNKIEGGLELGFLKDVVMVTASYYRNRTGNQLVGYSLPSITGATTVQANLPAVIENKGLELELNTRNIVSKNFTWTTSGNISFPRNKLVSYPNIESSSYSNSYIVGEPLYISRVYDYTGINPETGLYTFRDVNKDGAISTSNVLDRVPVFIGQSFFGGLSNTFKYKSFQLDIMLSFTKQKGQNFIFNSMPGLFGNQPRYVLNNSELQPFSQSTSSQYYKQVSLYNISTARITDASYIRVRNVALSWRFSDLLKNNHWLSSGRVYMQCQNLFTITGFKGLDPEMQSGFNVPPLRLMTAGIQITL